MSSAPRIIRISTLVAARVATAASDRARVVREGAALAQLALALAPIEEARDASALRDADANWREADAEANLRADRGLSAPAGRLVELCAGPASAQTSAAVMVLREAQAEGDPVAWVMARGAGLFPPDLAAAGLDLDALVVVHVPPDEVAAGPRATELILRTGAFGAVVLDLSSGGVPRGAAWQGRLLGLAREHACRVLLLSPHGRSRMSLGPLVSLRYDVRREQVGPGRYRVESLALKDKSGLLESPEGRRPCTAPLGLAPLGLGA